MATVEQVVELRRLIDEPDTDTFTDEQLSARIDGAEGTLLQLAGDIWREKAASFAGLVDVKEGNSDRKLSQLYKQAMEMANALNPSAVVDVASGRRRSRTRPIERQ